MNTEQNYDLDPRLKNDCFQLGQLTFCSVLLMNNAAIPWFILVPATLKTEIFELDIEEQMILLREINLISSYIKDSFSVSKLNIASIGNIVSQLHVHIVGRHTDDYCWPNVVWGTKSDKKYNDGDLNGLIDLYRLNSTANLLSLTLFDSN